MTQGLSKSRASELKRGRGHPINSLIRNEDGHFIVEWTCPKCNIRCDAYWFGRRNYICSHCNHQTNIKGQTIGTSAELLRLEVL